MNDETTQSLKKLWEDNAYPSTTPLYKLAKRRGAKRKNSGCRKLAQESGEYLATAAA